MSKTTEEFSGRLEYLARKLFGECVGGDSQGSAAMLFQSIYSLKILHHTTKLHKVLHEFRWGFKGGKSHNLLKVGEIIWAVSLLEFDADLVNCLLSSTVWIIRSGR